MSDLTQAVSSFLFKIGGRPTQTGGQHQANVPPAFPGGRCPKIEWLQTPDRLPDLVAEYRLASKYASDVMRNVTRVDAVPASPAMNGAAHPHLPANASPAEAGQSSVGPPPQAAPQKAEPNPALARILARQAVLAMRDDPASEAEYIANGELVRELSA
jgi:hypothetical protein